MSSTAGSHGSIQLRSTASLCQILVLNIRHPGCDNVNDLLLPLYALEANGGSFHGFVFTVCSLVAGNVEGGLLSSRASPCAQQSDAGIDEVAPAGDYLSM